MPANGAADVATDTGLSWDAAARAERYTVYFGADPTPVAAGDAGAQIADGADTAVALADALAEQTSYYWRVVAHNDDGATSSALWRFTTAGLPPGPEAPDAPVDPVPESGATGVAVDTDLRWAPSARADGYRVYFGDDIADVVRPENLIGETAETSIALPEPLATGGSYFWRVEAFNVAGATTGQVWGFETVPADVPGPLQNEAPANGATIDGDGVELSWTAAANAEAYAVFFSQSVADVAGGSADALIGEQGETTRAHMESEGFEIRTNVGDRSDPLVGGSIVFIGEDNESEGVDGTFEASLDPLVGGSYDFQFRRNRLVNDHDYGHRITWNGYQSAQYAQVPADATTDRSMVVEDSFYNGEDQLVDMDVRPVAGDTSVAVERNEVYSSRQGVDFDMEDADYTGDEGAQTVAWPVTSGSFALILRDNYIVADEDMFELTLRSYKPVGEVYIEGNRGLSTDDYGVDATIFDFTRAVIANNVFESYDDKAIEFDVAFQAGQPITTDVFVFHNDGRRSDDENMRLSSFYDTNRVSDETYGAMNVYIAGNSLYGSTESEGLESRVIGDSLVLVERNHIGYNDVDSDDAWQMSCNGIRRPFVRGRNNVLAYGAGAGISSERCGGTYTNNTIAYNNRDNTSYAGIDSNTNGDCDEAGCFDQSLWHSNVIAHNAWRDLDDDEYYQVPYSLIGQNPYPFVPGPGVVVADPLFNFCDDIQDLECYTFDRRSPTFDAGHPGEAWNDADGTRNDLGAFGGPWAGWIGWQGENQPMPVALLGVRPMGQLTTGRPLAAVDSTPTVVFSTDLADDAADALSVVDGGGAPVAGAWAIDRNRATFTPAQPLAAGGFYTVHMGAGIGGAAGEVAWAADRVTFVTAVDAVAEVEGGQAIGGDPVFSFTGELTAEADTSDTYTLDARAGDHLRLTVFADRLAGVTQNADVALRLRDADGTLLDADYDLFNSESEAARGQDPYIEYVFAQDRPVVVEVFIEDADDAATQTYRLDGVISPL